MSQPIFTPPSSRRSFLKRSAAAAPVLALAASVQARGASTPTSVPDLYPGWNAKNFNLILQNEMAHVQALVQALTPFDSAYPEPTFVNLAQTNEFDFAVTAAIFENTGVAAYLGAAPILSSPAVVATAGSILGIEARHSGYLNTLLDLPMTQGDENFDSPLTPLQVAQRVMPYFANQDLPMYLASQIQTTPSPDNDTRILKLALALEYLEFRFYTINVPVFYGQG